MAKPQRNMATINRLRVSTVRHRPANWPGGMPSGTFGAISVSACAHRRRQRQWTAVRRVRRTTRNSGRRRKVDVTFRCLASDAVYEAYAETRLLCWAGPGYDGHPT